MQKSFSKIAENNRRYGRDEILRIYGIEPRPRQPEANSSIYGHKSDVRKYIDDLRHGSDGIDTPIGEFDTYQCGDK